VALNTVQKAKIALIIMCIVALGALTYSWLVSQEGDACGPDWGRVSISTQDEYLNALRNVNVTLWSASGELLRTGLTDGQGKISWGHLSYSWYNLTLTKDGVHPESFEFVLNSSENRLKLSFILSYREYQLTIRVVDANSGANISNASVLLYRYDYLEEYQAFSGKTNGSGLLTFPAVEYDEYALVISHDSYFNYTTLLFMAEDIEIQVVLYSIPNELPPSEPKPPLSVPEVIIGITIGLIFGILVLYFFILQRKLRGVG